MVLQGQLINSSQTGGGRRRNLRHISKSYCHPESFAGLNSIFIQLEIVVCLQIQQGDSLFVGDGGRYQKITKLGRFLDPKNMVITS